MECAESHDTVLRMKLARSAFELAGFAEGADELALRAWREFNADGQLIVGGFFPFYFNKAKRGGDAAAGVVEIADEGDDADLLPANFDGDDAEDLLAEVIDG